MRRLNVMTRRRFGILAGAKLALTAIAARAHQGPHEHAVAIEKFRFDPAELTVRPGDMVVWTNFDTAPHTATDRSMAWDTGELGKGQSAPIRFDVVGQYRCFCRFHPNMKATVTVRA